MKKIVVAIFVITIIASCQKNIKLPTDGKGNFTYTEEQSKQIFEKVVKYYETIKQIRLKHTRTEYPDFSREEVRINTEAIFNFYAGQPMNPRSKRFVYEGTKTVIKTPNDMVDAVTASDFFFGIRQNIINEVAGENIINYTLKVLDLELLSSTSNEDVYKVMAVIEYGDVEPQQYVFNQPANHVWSGLASGQGDEVGNFTTIANQDINAISAYPALTKGVLSHYTTTYISASQGVTFYNTQTYNNTYSMLQGTSLTANDVPVEYIGVPDLNAYPYMISQSECNNGNTGFMRIDPINERNKKYWLNTALMNFYKNLFSEGLYQNRPAGKHLADFELNSGICLCYPQQDANGIWKISNVIMHFAKLTYGDALPNGSYYNVYNPAFWVQ